MNKYEKFFGTWATPLNAFLESEHWESIGKSIKQMQSEGKEIFPTFSQMFSPFRLCPYDELKVVIITVNPLTDGEYNGIPWGSYPAELIKPNIKPKAGDSRQLQILDKVLTAVKKDFPESPLIPSDLDLSRWCKQGVLMLNTNLTAIRGKKEVHFALWHPFVEYVMGMLKRQKSGIIYVLAGENAKIFRPMINLMQNDIIPVEHPITAVQKDRDWEHAGLFAYINRVLSLINDKKIKW
jgi:uracil-DNA glycosylase